MVNKILTTLANNGIKINVTKCNFFQIRVTLLGHVIDQEGYSQKE